MSGINIIFDGPPGPDGGRFVEIENDEGRSIRLGEWSEYPGHPGLWKLRITLADLLDQDGPIVEQLMKAHDINPYDITLPRPTEPKED